MPSGRFELPAPAAAPRKSLLARARAFALTSWPGRVLVGALVVLALQSMLPQPLSALAWLVAGAFALWAALLLGRRLLRALLWRIRTKLIVSYLFIAVVPLVLLTLLFALAGVLGTGLVASHLVTGEIERKARALERSARAALLGLPGGPEAARLLPSRLALGLEVHPELSHALVAGGQVLSSRGQAPAARPSWWRGPGFGGLVAEGEKESERRLVLRAGWAEADRFLVLEVPVDRELFRELETRTGLELLTLGGEVETSRSGLNIRVSTRERDRARRGPNIDGLMWIALPERLDWKTGRAEAEALTFAYQPLEFLRRLSPRPYDVAGLLVTILIAVGVVFVIVWLLALAVGFLLARSVTKSVHALHRGTQRLRQGDFTHPIRVRSRDQLGELAESFNHMASGIERLLVEQAERERLEEELRIARQIQMSLLPAGPVEMPGLRVAALCLPAAEVGGDYYDLLPLSPTRLAVLVADVSGKGTSAALYMAELKGLVLSLSRVHDSPARLLCEANRILGAHLDPRSFVTMTYAVVDVERGSMRFARAGHNPILFLEGGTARPRVLAPAGLGLGLDRGERFDRILEEEEVALAPGDVLLFFTDGLSEAMNERAELFGEGRLAEILAAVRTASSDEIRDRILLEISRFVGEAAQHDDMTLVTLKVL
jgi:sigma-B regulation protein RsbU (phosphoserine phosphatase)